jgi:hypothetical protein
MAVQSEICRCQILTPATNLMCHEPCQERAVPGLLDEEFFIGRNLGSRRNLLSKCIPFPCNSFQE